jgi:hypothetical protein
MKKLLIGGVGLAALATAAPSTAQYYGYTPYTRSYSTPYAYGNTYAYGRTYSPYSYGSTYSPYSYGNTYAYGNTYSPYSYGNNYAYGYGAMNTSAAASQCTAAVQNRLYTRQGLAGILGSLIGAYGTTGRVVGITRVTPNGSYTRVRGLASSGRYAGYNAADLSFKCDVDYRGYVRDIDINRR